MEKRQIALIGKASAAAVLLAGCLTAACVPRATPSEPVPTDDCPGCDAMPPGEDPTPYPFETVFFPGVQSDPPPAGSAGSIRIAVLPVIDAIPLYLAEERKYFERVGLEVRIIPVTSLEQRDRLMAGGELDAALDDLASVGWRSTVLERSVIVRLARVSGADEPVFSILAAPGTGINTIFGLKNRDLAVSERSGEQYAAEGILLARGLAPEEVRQISIPGVADRMVALESGMVAAALLPEPFATLAESRGAVRLAGDENLPEYGHFVYTFQASYVEENGDAVRGFLAAIEQAVADLRAGGVDAQPLLRRHELLPIEYEAAYLLPAFPTAAVPSALQWNGTVAWLREKHWIPGGLAYADFVFPQFLPRR